MKNSEKYTDIASARKAYDKHKLDNDCNCSFEKWLDTDEDKIEEAIKGIRRNLSASILTAGIGRMLGGGRKNGISSLLEDLSKFLDEEYKDVPVECPICHSKNASIDTKPPAPTFKCDDCHTFIGKHGSITHDVSEFKTWIEELCKKNNAKN